MLAVIAASFVSDLLKGSLFWRDLGASFMLNLHFSDAFTTTLKNP